MKKIIIVICLLVSGVVFSSKAQETFDPADTGSCQSGTTKICVIKWDGAGVGTAACVTPNAACGCTKDCQ